MSQTLLICHLKKPIRTGIEIKQVRRDLTKRIFNNSGLKQWYLK